MRGDTLETNILVLGSVESGEIEFQERNRFVFPRFRLVHAANCISETG